MNTINSSTLNVAAAAAANPGGTSKSIGDQFMKMLVTQLKNQDPLNPMDPSAMTAQLTQLNSLQQLENINGLLAKMAGGGSGAGATLSQAATAVGKVAQLALGSGGEAAFAAEAGSLHYDFQGSAAFSSQLRAVSPTGETLGSWKLDGPMGDVAVGKLPEGTIFMVASTQSDGKVDEARSGFAMLSQNMQVKGVALSGGSAYVVDPTGHRAPWGSVVGLS